MIKVFSSIWMIMIFNNLNLYLKDFKDYDKIWRSILQTTYFVHGAADIIRYPKNFIKKEIKKKLQLIFPKKLGWKNCNLFMEQLIF